MVLEKREWWLARAGEGRVWGGEDGEGGEMVEEGSGSEVENERHGEEAGVLEDVRGVEDGVGREGREEREEREEDEREKERGGHGRGALFTVIENGRLRNRGRR